MVDSEATGRPEDGSAAADSPGDVAMQALRRSLHSPFRVGFVLGGLVAIGAARIVIQNGQSAEIHWLWFDFSARLLVVLLTTLIAGALVWER